VVKRLNLESEPRSRAHASHTNKKHHEERGMKDAGFVSHKGDAEVSRKTKQVCFFIVCFKRCNLNLNRSLQLSLARRMLLVQLPQIMHARLGDIRVVKIASPSGFGRLSSHKLFRLFLNSTDLSRILGTGINKNPTSSSNSFKRLSINAVLINFILYNQKNPIASGTTFVLI
jgi:hypothetical protein